MDKNSKVEPVTAKPFIKWAGGKTQLLNELEKRFPPKIIRTKRIKRYIEPFVGGGALFFHLKRDYNIEESYLFDINKELVIAYKTLQINHKGLMDKLSEIEDKHLQKSEDKRKEYYYKIRNEYNRQMDGFDYVNYSDEWVKRTSFLIFLNKTCFNGLFRQNQKGEFNVPFGRYKNPKIHSKKNIIGIYEALQDTEVFCGDFTEACNYIEKESFIYLDPPYRPLNKTSNFTSYAKNGFNDEDQTRLAQFFKITDEQGAYLMLSNSDPKNQDIHDEFFDNLYNNYNIERITAKRNINCDASKRGEIKELIITNYLQF
ncbi:MAG: DNA adenine methylase [Methanobacterium sp.]|uniref:DNA adenine methylase n=1 Tax=Methanobacterium sp. TaxID=2164 RepID=UPI003D649492|nr:DNA adenine methylase [Methanobacterium sp.]